MDTRYTKLSAALLFVALLIAPAICHGFALRESSTGAIVRWHSERITVSFDSSLSAIGQPEAVEQALLAALGAWQASRALPIQLAMTESRGAEPGYVLDGENENTFMVLEGPWPYDPRWPAVTIVTFDPDSGAMLDADILFDGNRQWNVGGASAPGAIDFQDVATHEIGHLLGLEHSDVADATMYPIGGVGTIERRTLHSDDVDGLTTSYGLLLPVAEQAIMGCSAAGPASAGATPALLFLGVIPFLLRTRDRRRR